MKHLEDEITRQFRRAGLADPAQEARALIRCAESNSQSVNIQAWAAERIRGVPLAYLTGKKGFYKSEFHVRPGVLIPRPETEHVLEIALARVRAQNLTVRNLADLGCGSGCLGLSLLQELTAAHLWAIDRSAVACAVTTQNAGALNLLPNVTVIHEDVAAWQPKTEFELIVANPPYIADHDPAVQRSVHDFEPHEALYSGADGLEAIRQWSTWGLCHLVCGGVLVCEIGAGHKRVVQEIIGQLGFEAVNFAQDLSGRDRVISAIKAG